MSSLQSVFSFLIYVHVSLFSMGSYESIKQCREVFVEHLARLPILVLCFTIVFRKREARRVELDEGTNERDGNGSDDSFHHTQVSISLSFRSSLVRTILVLVF